MKEELLRNRKISNISEVNLDGIEEVVKDFKILEILKSNFSKICVLKFIYKSGECDVICFVAYSRKLDVSKKNKVVICLRGGSRDFGLIDPTTIFSKTNYFGWFPQANYITFYTQYRGNGGGTGIDEFGGKDLSDVKVLYKIIKKISFCDSKNVGIMGWSRGAQMIYQLLKTEKWIKSAICIAGATNHLRMIEENFRPEWKEHLIKMFGGSLLEIKKRSAIFWYKKIKKIPILIIHGTADKQVDVRDSIDLHKKLIKTKLILFKNDDHSLTLNREKAKKTSIFWFKKTL